MSKRRRIITDMRDLAASQDPSNSANLLVESSVVRKSQRVRKVYSMHGAEPPSAKHSAPLQSSLAAPKAGVRFQQGVRFSLKPDLVFSYNRETPDAKAAARPNEDEAVRRTSNDGPVESIALHKDATPTDAAVHAALADAGASAHAAASSSSVSTGYVHVSNGLADDDNANDAEDEREAEDDNLDDEDEAEDGSGDAAGVGVGVGMGMGSSRLARTLSPTTSVLAERRRRRSLSLGSAPDAPPHDDGAAGPAMLGDAAAFADAGVSPRARPAGSTNGAGASSGLAVHTSPAAVAQGPHGHGLAWGGSARRPQSPDAAGGNSHVPPTLGAHGAFVSVQSSTATAAAALSATVSNTHLSLRRSRSHGSRSGSVERSASLRGSGSISTPGSASSQYPDDANRHPDTESVALTEASFVRRGGGRVAASSGFGSFRWSEQTDGEHSRDSQPDHEGSGSHEPYDSLSVASRRHRHARAPRGHQQSLAEHGEVELPIDRGSGAAEAAETDDHDRWSFHSELASLAALSDIELAAFEARTSGSERSSRHGGAGCSGGKRKGRKARNNAAPGAASGNANTTSNGAAGAAAAATSGEEGDAGEDDDDDFGRADDDRTPAHSPVADERDDADEAVADAASLTNLTAHRLHQPNPHGGGRGGASNSLAEARARGMPNSPPSISSGATKPAPQPGHDPQFVSASNAPKAGAHLISAAAVTSQPELRGADSSGNGVRLSRQALVGMRRRLKLAKTDTDVSTSNTGPRVIGFVNVGQLGSSEAVLVSSASQAAAATHCDIAALLHARNELQLQARLLKQYQEWLGAARASASSDPAAFLACVCRSHDATQAAKRLLPGVAALFSVQRATADAQSQTAQDAPPEPLLNRLVNSLGLDTADSPLRQLLVSLSAHPRATSGQPTTQPTVTSASFGAFPPRLFICPVPSLHTVHYTSPAATSNGTA